MRITGGTLCGRRLVVPSGPVRPTQDRVREALFSSLSPYMDGARVLDLYAGTGSLGLEAWSRGAEKVCWVESDRRVFRTLKENVRTLCGPDAAGIQCVNAEALRFLKHPSTAVAGPGWLPFDFILADPPYDRHTPHEGLEQLMRAVEDSENVLAPDGWLVFEQHDVGTPLERSGWMLRKDKRYGETRLRYYQRTTAIQEKES